MHAEKPAGIISKETGLSIDTIEKILKKKFSRMGCFFNGLYDAFGNNHLKKGGWQT